MERDKKHNESTAKSSDHHQTHPRPLRGSWKYDGAYSVAFLGEGLGACCWPPVLGCSRPGHGPPGIDQYPEKLPLAHAMQPVAAISQTGHGQQPQAAGTKIKKLHWPQVSGPFPKLHMRPTAVWPASEPKSTTITPHPGGKQVGAPASAQLEIGSVVPGKLSVSVCLTGVAVRGVLPTNAAPLVKLTPASAPPGP